MPSEKIIPPEEERFIHNLICFVNFFKRKQKQFDDKYRVSPILMDLVIAYLPNVNKIESINDFINHTHKKMWDHVKARNSEFVDFKQIMPEIKDVPVVSPEMIIKNIEMMHHVFNKGFYTKEEEKEIWTSIDIIIKIAIKYVLKNRKLFPEITNKFMKRQCKAFKVDYF
jgi:hypothetical protein